MSSGLGQAIAIALAEAGADVACHCRTTGQADATISEIEKIGRKAFKVTGDLSDESMSGTMVDKVISEFGQLDILINNAGTIRRSPAVEYSRDDWNTVIQVNLSAFSGSQAAGKHMTEARHRKDRKHRVASIVSGRHYRSGIYGFKVCGCRTD